VVVWLVKGVSALLARLPAGLAERIGCGLGWLFYLCLLPKRRLAQRHLAEAFPEWTEQKVRETARAVCVNQGRLLAEVLRGFGQPRREPLDDILWSEDALADLEASFREKGGGLVLTAHVNNYEWLSAWSSRRYTMTIVVKPIKPAALNEHLNQRRGRFGMTMLPHKGSYRRILQAAKGGGVIGFILDQNMKRGDGVFTTFFGKPASTSAGLALLSAHTGMPVTPVFLMREGSTYRLRVLPSIPPPVDRSAEALQDTTQLYTSAVEQVVREDPVSWIWMHRRWKTQPAPGERITLPDGTAYHAR
jgi:KDO2-lipid IV(A) lauroyltransferase